MKFVRHLSRALFLLWTLFLLSGCISIDPRATAEKVDVEATSTLKGVFNNTSFYQSQQRYDFSKETLAEAIGLYGAKKATDVEIDLEEKKLLHIRFLLDGKELASKDYSVGTDFKLSDEGKIEFNSDHQGGLDPHGGVGYGASSMVLFINVSGDLVCINSGGGAGLLFLALPFAAYQRHMTIHHKSTP